MSIGSNVANVDGKSKMISAAPKIVNRRTMIPLRFVSEQFGKYVEWVKDASTGITYIWITSKKLLTISDFANVSKDYSEHYLDDSYPDPYYVLKKEGTTNRGISIGSLAGDVVAAYGAPHRIKQCDGIGQKYFYYGLGIPYTENTRGLIFYFEDARVVQVEAY
jgi:hypothetical protein